MLTNATILRLDVPTGQSTGGQLTYATGGAISVRCFVANDENAAKYAGPEELAEKRAVIVRAANWDLAANGLTLATGQTIAVAADGQPAVDYRVRTVTPKPFGSLSFVEVQCLQT